MGQRICSIEGCGRKHSGRGYCPGHYMQAKEGRSIAPLTGKALTPAERFEARVDRTPSSGCHLWTGSPDSSGYGSIFIAGRQLKAHRVAFEREHGPIPAGMLVDHACHNRLCVNPAHLRLVDKSGNAQNRRGAIRGSASGVRGVYRAPRQGGWVACVTVGGVRHQVGYFREIPDAEFAVVTARARLHRVHSPADLAYLADRGLAVSDLKNKAQERAS